MSKVMAEMLRVTETLNIGHIFKHF